ncbi:MAG: ABC transporter ATP-binding protein [Hyphomicrobiaceae bacterium]|nr:ABC transporter ATP-binding protein [Hyphomicrobiaceae bacterium]
MWSMPTWGVPMLLEVKDLEVAYGDFQVVWGVSLNIDEGEVVTLLGPNGSGKSTVINTVSGLVPVLRGDILVDGASIAGQPTHNRAHLGIAHVLERRRVFPYLTVQQNLILGAWHRDAKAARDETYEHVCDMFPILRDRSGQLAHTLSGGEQQMLALARGLMAKPRLLMVDEPFLGLAPQIIEQMKQAFEDIRSTGIAILFIEQNVRLALSMADRGYVLESGRMAVSGKAKSLMNHKTVRRVFLGA